MNQSSQPLEFKTVSGFKTEKSNCRKLLTQSIICILQCFFLITSIKDIAKSKKIHRTTLEVFRNLLFNSGLP